MVKRYARYLAGLGNVVLKPARVAGRPLHLILENTTVCPFNCIMCSRAVEVKDPHHMEYGFFTRILDEVDPLHLYLSSAGEPLLHPEQPRMIRYAKGKGIKTCIVTTLAISAFPLEELAASGIDLVKVSMDGATEGTYQRIRGNDLYPRVMENLKELAAAKKRLGRERPFVRFQFVVQKENYREAPEIVRLAHRCGVQAVFFKPLTLMRIEDRADALTGGIDFDELAAKLSEARALGRRLGVNHNIDDFLSYLLPNLSKVYRGGEGFTPLSRQCIVPWFSTFVRIHGEVAFCCYAKMEDAKVESMADKDFRSIWSGARYRDMRAALRAGGFPMPDCRLCVPQRLSHLFDYRRIIPGFSG